MTGFAHAVSGVSIYCNQITGHTVDENNDKIFGLDWIERWVFVEASLLSIFFNIRNFFFHHFTFVFALVQREPVYALRLQGLFT